MIVADDKKMETLKSYMDEKKKAEHPEAQLIAILHKSQALYGYLSREIMNEIALTMGIPRAHIWGVATFYHYFNLKPQGKHTIYICMGTACYVKGAGEVLDTIKKELKIKEGETTADGMFTLREARCLGACGLAPVIMIDDKIYGELTPKKVKDILRNISKKEGK